MAVVLNASHDAFISSMSTVYITKCASVISVKVYSSDGNIGAVNRDVINAIDRGESIVKTASVVKPAPPNRVLHEPEMEHSSVFVTSYVMIITP